MLCSACVCLCLCSPQSGRCCRARTHPSRRGLCRSRQGLVSLPGAHTSIQTRLVGCGCWPVGQAGLLGTFWCAASFLLPFCSSCGPPRAVRALVVSEFCCFRPSVSWASPLCGCCPFVPLFSSRPAFVCLSVVSGSGCLGLGALWLTPALSSFFFLFFCTPCVRFSVASGLGCAGPRSFLAASRRLYFFFFIFSFLTVRCPAVPCCCLRCFVVCVVVGRCPVLWCFLWCCVLAWCAVSSRRLVRRAVLRCVSCVGLSCSATRPPCCCLCCRACCCCVVGFCVLSCGTVPCCSAVPPVPRCAVVCVVPCCVVLCCLVCAGLCRVLVPSVSGCLLLGLVVPCCPV